MGFIRTAIKGAVAGKAIQAARKPGNQQKAKSLFNRLRGKDQGTTTRTTRKGTTAGTKAGKPAGRSRTTR